MHIAMWTCARSRSTLLLRSFQQRSDCVTLDEPLYAPYLTLAGLDHPLRSEILASRETDYDTVIRQMSEPLPANVRFSFQKHTANNVRLNEDLDWLTSLKSFFLIRNPAEILLSRQAVYQTERSFTLHEIGLRDLHELFSRVRQLTDATPLVLDSTDLVNAPRAVLSRLCDHMGIAFSDSMLAWEPGERSSDPVWATRWYKTLINSSGFLPHEPREIELPDHLQPVFEECLPYYESLYRHRIQALES